MSPSHHIPRPNMEQNPAYGQLSLSDSNSMDYPGQYELAGGYDNTAGTIGSYYAYITP